MDEAENWFLHPAFSGYMFSYSLSGYKISFFMPINVISWPMEGNGAKVLRDEESINAPRKS